MKARLVVFPIKGRNWCFTKAIKPLSSIGNVNVSESETKSDGKLSTLKGLWKQISSNGKPIQENTELVVDFVSDKMNQAWVGLEKAPQGTIKNRIHGLGLRLLDRVKPSETFLKSISKEITEVEISYPTSLNPRLVRRRLRHIAYRGTIIHRRYFYGSVVLLPFTSALAVLPLPNVPFFWVLFRTYSHWQALKGSERLLELVSDSSMTLNSPIARQDKNQTVREDSDSEHELGSPGLKWVLKPSEELEELFHGIVGQNGINKDAIFDICKACHLDTNEVLKYRKVT